MQDAARACGATGEADLAVAGFETLLEDSGLFGAKLALWSGPRMLCYKRDDFDHIPDPGHWDLPGGVREPGETIRECAMWEVQEEFSITLAPDGFGFAARFVKFEPSRIEGVFLTAALSDRQIDAIVFGDEGQCWEMMPVAKYLGHPRGVRELQSCVALWWEGLDG